MNSKFCADIGQQKLFKTYALPQNTEQLFHKPKLKWKGQPRTEYCPRPPTTPLSPAVAEEGAPHWVGDSVWRMIEVPACAEHFKYLQRYFKKRSWHVLLLLCLRVQSSTVSQAFACCRMFCSFFGRAAEREVQLQMRHEGCPVAGNKGEEWRGAVRGTVNGLRHLSACVLLGKCQKPLVKKPYGNYSTQLNMKCGKGSAVSPGMRLGGIEGRKLKKVAALGK